MDYMKEHKKEYERLISCMNITNPIDRYLATQMAYHNTDVLMAEYNKALGYAAQYQDTTTKIRLLLSYLKRYPTLGLIYFVYDYMGYLP